MTREIDQHIRWGEPSTDCPNCEETAIETDQEDESHWTVAYKYGCPSCGCEYWWSKAECDDGLSGWELRVMDWGDIRQWVDYTSDIFNDPEVLDAVEEAKEREQLVNDCANCTSRPHQWLKDPCISCSVRPHTVYKRQFKRSGEFGNHWKKWVNK